jgi:hypothetical protein
MTNEQLQQAINKTEFIKGLGFFKELQDAANEEKFLQGVQVNGTALTETGGVVNVTATMEKLVTAESGCASSYQMKVNGVAVGDKINIAKDWVLSGVDKGTVAAADKATGGKFETDNDFVVGDKFIDFAFNVKTNGDGGTETTTHIYLNVQDLVDTYLNGLGLNLVNGEFSIKIDASNANGLSVGANGLALALATADADDGNGGITPGTAGAMSAADKNYLEGLKATTFTTITKTDIQALFA